MARQIFVYIIHKEGKADDTAIELITAAKAIDAEAKVTAIAAGSGEGLDAVCAELTETYPEVWKVGNDGLGYVNAEVLRPMMVKILPQGAIVLAAHEHFGMDFCPGLSVKLNGAFLPDATGFDGVDGDTLRAVREEYSGMVSAHVTCDISAGAVISIRPGAFSPEETGGAGGSVIDKSAEASEGASAEVGRRFLEIVEAEKGDVDITKADVLLSIGRGIEDEENLEIAFDLAKAMGAEVSCSRPIVDAKWLEKPRQVGTSGQTVKPKVYMACGISGSFQHMGGIKGAPFVVAINKNPKAPIFQVADVGIVADILDFMPELQEAIEEMKA